MSLPWPGVLEPGLLKDEVVARNHRLAVLETLVSDERWREWLVEWAHVGRADSPGDPRTGRHAGRAVAGAGRLAAYAGAALLLGGVLFQVRDA